MRLVKKIIFRNKETYDKLYQGAELLFKVNKVVWKGLTFTAIEPSTIKYTKSSVTTAQYSYDAVNWVTADGVTLSLNTGDKVYFKGNITGDQDYNNIYAYFTMTGKVEASGSLMSMQSGNPLDISLKYNSEFVRLFENCKSLVKAPDLPATTLTERCYMNLFVGCGLTEPTALPATTLAVRCYQNLFNGCKSLVYGPELPATKMVDNCYANLFLNCSSLTKAPELPSTTLAEGCYQGMFYTCTSLTTAPELPATTLVTDCYKNMFGNCSNLNYIKALFTTTPGSSYTTNWVKGVASTGTFVKNSEATWNVTGINGVPTGWTIQSEVVWEGLTFTALEPSTIQYIPSSVSTAQCSFNKVNWFSADNETLELNKGEKVYFKGNITGNQGESNYARFTITGNVAASGSIMSMQAGDPYDKTLNYNYEFYRLLYNCTSLVTAPELPATTLKSSCYDGLFYNCTSIVNAPDLPATTLTDFCYRTMFKGCTSLITAPDLPVNIIKTGCYISMFNGCTSIKTAPNVLPATTLENFCYSYMFSGCTNLVKAPVLPATKLRADCYKGMFEGCSKLNYIKCYAKEYNSNWFTDWVKDVAHTGDFYCYDSSIFPTGGSGIPTGWTVHIEVEHKEYDALYVSGHYNFKIPKGDGTYYVIDTKNDCEADVITNKLFTSINSTIIGSGSVGDQYEWELFFNNDKLYLDLSYKNNRRLYWRFNSLRADTLYTIGGSNGNYLGTDRALYVNGSKKVSSTTKSTYNNTSDLINIGENIYDFYVGNIKIYENTGLVYNIVPIMYNGNIAFYDKVNKRFMEIKSTPPSEYVKTRATGEKVII